MSWKLIIYILLILQSQQLSAQANKLKRRTWSRGCHDSISNGNYWDKDPYLFTYIDFKKNGDLFYNHMCNFVRKLSTFPDSNKFVKWKTEKGTLFLYTRMDSIFKYKFSIVHEKDTLYKDRKGEILFKRYSLLLIAVSGNRKYLFESLEAIKMNGEPTRKILRRNRKLHPSEKTGS